MDINSWPYFACVGISESSALSSLPGNGCGVCVEVQCIENGPVRLQLQPLWTTRSLCPLSEVSAILCCHGTFSELPTYLGATTTVSKTC